MKKELSVKVAVIGAGAAGLTATKRLSEPGNGFSCCTFEQTDNVGGTWVYTEQVDKDEFGLPVHSSMYSGLRTNLPKEIMQLPDFPHPEGIDRSYLKSDEILKYFERYADHFDLKKYMKFRHHVNSVTPLDDGRWKIVVTDLIRQKESTYFFDAVIVCIGNYSNPAYPDYKGKDLFEGLQMHSHTYRKPDTFKDMNVVVVGAGSSGLDITYQLSRSASKVILSHHSEKAKKIEFPNNVIQKTDIEELTKNGVIFKDGTYENIDAILYCTGYTYTYPFLSSECGIKVENTVVKPLYKQFINIENPTMCFIGIPRDCPGFTMFDLQVRSFLSVLKGVTMLPSKERMLEETQNDFDARIKKSGKEKYYHILSKDAQMYFNALSDMGHLPYTRQVVFDIYFSGLERAMQDFKNFRNMKYRIVDDKNYSMFE